MNPARLLTAAPAVLAMLPTLLLTVYAVAHRLRLLARHRPEGHRQVVAAALEDWRITTDPLAPFNPADVAEQVDLYLHSSGYTITPDTRKHPMPTRRSIAAVTLITLLCAASAVFTAHRHEWGWAAIGALATTLLTREILRDLTDRRHGRDAR